MLWKMFLQRCKCMCRQKPCKTSVWYFKGSETKTIFRGLQYFLWKQGQTSTKLCPQHSCVITVNRLAQYVWSMRANKRRHLFKKHKKNWFVVTVSVVENLVSLLCSCSYPSYQSHNPLMVLFCHAVEALVPVFSYWYWKLNISSYCFMLKTFHAQTTASLLLWSRYRRLMRPHHRI